MKKSAGSAAARVRTLWFKTFFFLFIASVLIWLIILFVTTVDKTAADWDMLKNKKTQVETSSKATTTSPDPDINIKQIIANINREEKIFNVDTFGPLKNDSLVIVVQVHSRISYLKYLIASLSVAKGISNVLIIFSHDFYDQDINTLIRSIDFCKVMQIFYPYSIQMYPDQFPGMDTNDCPPNTPKNKAVRMLCKNALSTDKNGKYRIPSSVQVKHHWWWKANRVFDLAALRNYNRLVLFLEEDLFLVDDFISMLRLMEDAARDYCDYCKILSLADNGDAIYLDRANFDKSAKATVVSQFSNMGFSFNRATWAEMVDCRHAFCVYDDYNWDFSLQHIFTTCMGKTAAMTLSAPRVFHMGTCGMHFQSDNCNPSETVAHIHRILTESKNRLYPENLTLFYRIDNKRVTSGFGGWGDPRDHALCLGMTIK